MARPWRAGGDGRSVSIPELPWKKEKPVPVLHATTIHAQGHDQGLASLYYFACTCGACGTLQDTRDGAREEAHRHLQWVERHAGA